MSAESAEKIFDLSHGSKHIISFDGSAGSLHHSVLRPGKDEDRARKALPDPSGYNTRQRFMTIRKKDHQNPVIQQVLPADKFQRLFNSLFREALAAVVQLPQLLGAAQGPARIILHKQGEGSLGIVQTSGGVQTGTDHKSRVVCGNGFLLQSVDQQQALQPDVCRIRDAPQAFPDQNPVFIRQGHDITHGGKGAEGKQLLQDPGPLFRNQFFQEQVRKLPGDNSSADIRERIIHLSCLRIADLGIHHRVRRREDIFFLSVLILFEGHFMVVCDDHADPRFPGGKNCFPGRDPVVTGQDHPCSVLRGVLSHTDIHAITVFYPVRKHHIRTGAAGGEGAHQNVGGADSVHVIITDHTDRSSALYFLTEDPDGLFHVRQKPGRPQIGDRPAQKPPGRFYADHIPVPDHPGQDRRDSAGLRDSTKIRFLGINHPLSHFACTSRPVKSKECFSRIIPLHGKTGRMFASSLKSVRERPSRFIHVRPSIHAFFFSASAESGGIGAAAVRSCLRQ